MTYDRLGRTGPGLALVLLAVGVGPGAAKGPPPAGSESPAPSLTALWPPGLEIGGLGTLTLIGRDLAAVRRVVVSGEVRSAAPGRVTAEVRVDRGAAPGVREVRVEGPGGVSDLRLIRVDRLSQTPEHESNDVPSSATNLHSGSAAVGVLGHGDVDNYWLTYRKGTRLLIEVEARRLGVALRPTVGFYAIDGRRIAEATDTPGLAGDAGLELTVPDDCAWVVRVEDRSGRGRETATYRLRVSSAPYATGIFPLGGPPGARVTFTASGGNLGEGLSQTLLLPDRPGEIVSLPPFMTPKGPVTSPARVVVGDGPETAPAQAAEDQRPPELPRGTTANGRIDRPGACDRYILIARRGEPVRLTLVASALNAAIDSVLTLRDPGGKILAANDDGPGCLDSSLAFTPDDDGLLTVEVADRYARGGPGYAYRLTEGPSRVGFDLRLADRSPDAWSLAPGGQIRIPLRLRIEGATCPIRVTLGDPPAGVWSDPLTIDPATFSESGDPPTLVVHAHRDAAPMTTWVRILVTSTSPGRPIGHGEEVTRAVTAERLLDQSDGPGGPIACLYSVSRFPLSVRENPLARSSQPKIGSERSSAGPR